MRGKQLINYVEQSEITELHTSLSLHTTSIVPSDSIFYDWNSLGRDEKYRRLKSNLPTTSIEKYYNNIVNAPKETVLTILSKFNIDHSQPQILEKWSQLLAHSFFSMFPENRRSTVLEKMCGYIGQRAIKDNQEWKINKNDFDQDMRDSLSVYVQNSAIFPVVSTKEVSSNVSYEGYSFVSEIKFIKIKEQDVINALSDYLRANVSQIKLLTDMPTLKDNLDLYDQNIERSLSEQKRMSAEEITSEHINTDTAFKLSRKIYNKSITAPHSNIRGVDQTEIYYRNGRIHHIVEESLFSWHYREEDL